jgi:hypothetical protein
VKSTMFQKLTAAATSILLLLTPSFATNHREPATVVQQGSAIANIELLKQAPTAQQMFDLSTSLEKWAIKSQADGTFTAAESWIAQNSAAIVSGQYNDVSTVYGELVANGYTPTKEGDQPALQKIVDRLFNNQRKDLVATVQKQGLYKYSLALAAQAHSIGLGLQNQGQFRSLEMPGICEKMMDLGNDMMALGAIIAVFDPPAGAAMAAAGAATYFYGRFVCPYTEN